MIDRLPKWSQAPIKQFIETGKFKDHEPSPMPAREAREAADSFRALGEEYIAQDNKPGDSNPAVGIIETREDYIGDVKAEYNRSQDGKNFEGFATLAGAEAVLYARDTPEAMDVLVVTKDEGADDGVFHLSHTDPNGSYVTFENGGGFLLS